MLAATPSATPNAFPEPLELSYVLTELDITNHHDLLISDAESLGIEAQVADDEASYATDAAINLRARWIDKNELSLDPSNQDHKASLNVRKRLYDFGVTGELEQSGESLLAASKQDSRVAASLHKIQIARAYFDVLLADMEYGWSNEAMAMDYVTLDKKRDKFELKQLDEIELLEEETRYQLSLSVRTDASLKQRVTRARLAEVLAAPGALPSELVVPKLASLQDAVADPQALIDKAMQASPVLLAQSQRVSAAESRYQADSGRWKPSLSADLEIAEYSRKIPSREDWRAGLNLKIPLFENGMHRADAAESYAGMKLEMANLNKIKSGLRQDIHNAWRSITTLVARSKALAVSVQYANRALDKSRGEYELELRTDFGDAQVRVSRARLDKATVDYQLAIEKMKLALLLGEDPIQVVLGNRQGE